MNKEGYAVVEFLYEMVDDQPLVQEVPKKWLTDSNRMCWWPPKHPYKEIKMATEPDVTSWHKHEVRLRKIYADMNEARQKCLLPSDFEEEEMGKHRRKKKETYKHMFRDASHSPPPQPSLFCAETSSMTDSDIACRNISSVNNDVAGTLHSSLLQPTQSCSNNFRSENYNGSNELPNLTDISQSYSQSLASNPVNSSNNVSISEVNLSLKGLTDEIFSMRKQMQEMFLHVRNIGEILDAKFKGKSEINTRFKDIFPLKDEGALKDFSHTLVREPQLVEDLKLYLNGIGGSGPKDHHGRMFKAIFSNELGMKCSWKGQRGNIKLENENLILTCMYVLKHTWKTTDKEFEIFSQDWLRHCTQRKKREDGKNAI